MATEPVLASPSDLLFRQIMGRYPTGVVVVTGHTTSNPVGMAMNSFTSVSLDPPIILFCPALSSSTWPELRHAGGLAVNLLARSQADVCRRFALKGEERFDGVDWTPGTNGAPLLADALAWIECSTIEEQQVGDHAVVLASVDRIGHAGTAPDPLIFLAGSYVSHLRPPADAKDGRQRSVEGSNPSQSSTV